MVANIIFSRLPVLHLWLLLHCCFFFLGEIVFCLNNGNANPLPPALLKMLTPYFVLLVYLPT